MRHTSAWRLAATLTGLGLVVSTGLADTTNVIAHTAFGSDLPGSMNWNYGYFYPDAENQGSEYQVDAWYTDMSLPEGTQFVLRYSWNAWGYEHYITNTPGTSWGTGFGGPQYREDTSAALFVSSNIADYIVSFDARAEGFLDGVTSASFEMQTRIWDTNDTVILAVNRNFTVTTQWTHFSYPLDLGSLADGTTEASFAAKRAGIEPTQGVRFGVNIHNPHLPFGFDFFLDNALLMDNLKLEVIERAGVQPPVADIPIVEWDFDAVPGWWSWGYSYAEKGQEKILWSVQRDAGGGVDGSNAWLLTMDNSQLAGDPGTWAGAGAGCGGPVDKAEINTTDLSQYKLYLDTRATGLLAGQSSAGGWVEVKFRAPDDTLEPPDADENPDAILVLRKTGLAFAKDWQRFGWTLDRFEVRSGSVELLEANLDRLPDDCIEMQYQVDGLHNRFEFAPGNTAAVDNVQLVRQTVGLPPLDITLDGSTVSIGWTESAEGTVRLLHATDLQLKDWTPVDGATNPYEVPGGANMGYYRVEWIAP